MLGCVGGAYAIGDGKRAIRITKTGQVLSFDIDVDMDGTYAAWGTDIDLATLSNLNSSNSRLFLGTGAGIGQFPQFDNFSLTSGLSEAAVPEPATLLMTLAGMALVAGRRYARRR